MEKPVGKPSVDVAHGATEDLAGALAELRQEIRCVLARLEDKQAHLLDPAGGDSVLSRGISAEMRATSSGTGAAQFGCGISPYTGQMLPNRGSRVSTESVKYVPHSPPTSPKSWKRSTGLANLEAPEAPRISSSGVVSNVRQVSWFLVQRHETSFDMLMGVIIIANSMSVGLEMQYELDGKDASTIALTEHVCLAIFVLEIFVRTCARGRATHEGPLVSVRRIHCDHRHHFLVGG